MVAILYWIEDRSRLDGMAGSHEEGAAGFNKKIFCLLAGGET
jgi:hypothetical protein